MKLTQAPPIRLLLLSLAGYLGAMMMGCASAVVVDDLRLRSVERVEENAYMVAPLYRINLRSRFSLSDSRRPFYVKESFCDLKFKKNWRSGEPTQSVRLGAGAFQGGEDIHKGRRANEDGPTRTEQEIEYQVYVYRAQSAQPLDIPGSIAFDQEKAPMDVCIYFGTPGTLPFGNGLITNTVRIPKEEFLRAK